MTTRLDSIFARATEVKTRKAPFSRRNPIVERVRCSHLCTLAARDARPYQKLGIRLLFVQSAFTPPHETNPFDFHPHLAPPLRGQIRGWSGRAHLRTAGARTDRTEKTRRRDRRPWQLCDRTDRT